MSSTQFLWADPDNDPAALMPSPGQLQCSTIDAQPSAVAQDVHSPPSPPQLANKKDCVSAPTATV